MKWGEQTKLAEAAGVCDASVSRRMQDKGGIRWETAKKLARVTGTRPDVWMDGPSAAIVKAIKDAGVFKLEAESA